ncbi:hypothetical protein HZH66_001401 [Vespula vulgaris]|uniref:Uncharacterized protein n=1 Tax=Vespula vulgaris TaxID=7454 RepID=A0A834NKL8_VESVU|nr:hypothetical protein HZH66_001401 [Vespula vulgaris]
MHYQRPFRSPSSGPSSSTTFPPAPRRRARTKREEFDQGTEETAIAEAKATAEVAACSSSYEEHRTARASKQARKQASKQASKQSKQSNAYAQGAVQLRGPTTPPSSYSCSGSRRRPRRPLLGPSSYRGSAPMELFNLGFVSEQEGNTDPPHPMPFLYVLP